MNSIKKSYHLPFVITLSFALGGLSCSRDATPRNPQDASFVVDQPVTLVKSEQSVGSSSMSVPVKNAMTFSACIKDRAKLAPVISQQFAIHSETGTINVTTNAEGCLSWSEEIPFNYLQDETYVESTHTIEGLGPFLGSRDVNLALDPWQTGGDAMVDMRQNPNIQKLVSGKTVGEALQAAIVSGVSKPSRVRVNSIATESDDIRSSGSSATINLRVNLAPSLTRTNLAGNLVNEQIMHGNFSIALTLIERVQSGTQNPADDQLLILAQNSASGSLDQTGHLNVSAPLVLQRMPNPSSIIELAFRLTPTDSPDSLASEEGLTRIGTIAGLRGQNSLTVTRPDISSYLQQAERDTELFQTLGSAKNPMGTSSTSPACSDGSSELGFYLSQVAVQWTGVKDRTPNEQVPSSVIASVMVCLNNSIDRSALANRVFEVGFDNESTSQVTTDNSGCFRWNEPVAFDYFAPERWILKNMHITSDSAPVQNVNRSFPLYLDPWQNDQNFFWDCRKGALPTFQAKPAQIEMTDFTYSFVGRDLNIDSSLNLTITHRFQIEVVPQFHRTVGYGGLSTYETVNDGRYHMRVLLLSPDRDETFSSIEGASNQDIIANFKYLSSYEADIQTRNGRVIQEVPLPIAFTSVPMLMTRNVLLVQLSAIESNSNLVSQPFYTPFLTNTDYGVFGLSPSKGASTYQNTATANAQMKVSRLNLDALIQSGKKSQARLAATGSSTDTIKSQFGVKDATQAQLRRAGLSAANIHSLFASTQVSPQTAVKLCLLVGMPQATCTAHAQGTYELLRTSHVESLGGTPQVINSNYKTLSIGASMSFSEGYSSTLSKGDGTTTDATASTDVGGGFNFFGFFKAGADASLSKGKNWFNSTTKSKSVGVTNSQNDSLGRSFSVEQMTFSIPTTNHQCMTVRRAGGGLKKSSGNPELMICENSGSRNESMTETYAVLTEMLGYQASTFRDPHSVTDSPWVKVVRGTQALDEVIKTLADQSKTMILTPTTQAKIIDPTAKTEDNFATTAPDESDGAIPGVEFMPGP